MYTTNGQEDTGDMEPAVQGATMSPSPRHLPGRRLVGLPCCDSSTKGIGVLTLCCVLPWLTHGQEVDAQVTLPYPKIFDPVPVEAPQYHPPYFFVDENLVDGSPCEPVSVYRDIIAVRFKPDATQGERQEAVEQVEGQVVAGMRLSTREGIYYVRVPARGSGERLCSSKEKMSHLSQIAEVSLEQKGMCMIPEGCNMPPPEHWTVLAEDGPRFMPHDIHPRVLNPEALERDFVALAPAVPEDGHTEVRLRLLLDAFGIVRDIEFDATTGDAELAEAVAALVANTRFAPAVRCNWEEEREESLAVWMLFNVEWHSERVVFPRARRRHSCP